MIDRYVSGSPEAGAVEARLPVAVGELVDGRYRVERVPLHHGQLRVHVQRREEGTIHPRVAKLIAAEKAAGLDQIETFRRFAEGAMAGDDLCAGPVMTIGPTQAMDIGGYW